MVDVSQQLVLIPGQDENEDHKLQGHQGSLICHPSEIPPFPTKNVMHIIEHSDST